MIDGFLLQSLTWAGIAFCISQSAIFSGLNLALLGISRLRLEVEASSGSAAARKILSVRKDFNYLLTTILWGNVAVNVLLAQLADSVMAGVAAFLFSTFLITFVGEIIPQAYFSRHAMEVGSRLSPLIRGYQVLLFPVARPTAAILDWWLGEEGIRYFNESDLRTVIRRHIDADASDINRLEGIGAMNFLALDDLVVSQEGERIDPESIIALPSLDGRPRFPEFEGSPDDSFLQRINASGQKWVTIVDETAAPCMVLNANAFLREALFGKDPLDPLAHCHRPIVVEDPRTLLGNVVSRLHVEPMNDADDVVDDDLILVWTDEKRIITGADILGRLLRGIALRDLHHPSEPAPGAQC